MNKFKGTLVLMTLALIFFYDDEAISKFLLLDTVLVPP